MYKGHCTMASQWWNSFMEAPDYYEVSPWFPDPFICLRDMFRTGTKEVLLRLSWDGVGNYINETWRFILSHGQYNDLLGLLLPVMLAVLLTLLRFFLNWQLLKRIPEWCNFIPAAAINFPEVAWKLIFSICTFTLSLFLILSRKNIFFNLRSHWDGWDSQEPLPSGIFCLYMIQISFYIHSSVCWEVIGRDFAVLMTHHVVSLILLLASYLFRLHIIGLLLVAILDSGDVFVDIAKIAVYFKDSGRNSKAKIIADVFFLLFTIHFVLCRLYWFPTKVIYSITHISVQVLPGRPFYLALPLLWMIYVMQVYWFVRILRLLWKIFVTGQDLKDQEYEEEEENKKKS